MPIEVMPSQPTATRDQIEAVFDLFVCGSKEMITADRASDSAPQIPPEVWTLIFEHLSSSDLSRARLTCRRWNQLIVGSPSLLGKFELKLLEKTLRSEDDPIKVLLASATIRFSRVLLHGESFIDAGTWWPRIGRNLQVMEMRNRVIDIADLLELLRGTPKLKVLKVYSKYSAEVGMIPQIDFALDSLEVLELETDCPTDLLCMLAQMCPRLKEFSLKVVPIVGLDPESVLREVLDFIRAVRNSLESVSVSGTEDNLLEELLNVEGSRLKRVSLTCYDREILSEPGKEQSSVEELRVNICSDEVLCDIGKTLPNLTKLSCGFFENQPTIVQFPSFMPKLKDLQIASQWIEKRENRLNFPTLKHHQLASLTLLNGKHTLAWIEHFPNLRTMKLHNAKIPNWPQFYAAISLLKALNSVKLKCVKADQHKDLEDSPTVTNIEDLNVICCDVSKDFLATLISSCPKLVNIHLENMQIVDDDTVRALCESSKHLKSLSFCGLTNVTHESVNTIAEYRPQLDKVSFEECQNVTSDAVEALRKTNIYNVLWREWRKWDGEED